MSKLMLYSPMDVEIIIAGFHKVTGLSDGTFISISKDFEPFETERAMDGSVQRVYRHDEGFTLELTLAQSSPTNNILSALYNMDVATQIGKFPIFVKDGRGSTSFFALTSWINGWPTVSFSNNLETRTWSFTCTQATLTVGGNAEQNAIEQALDFASSLLPLFKEFGVF